MLNKLREETGELHREIEQDNLASLIISHKIHLEEYKLLLLQNYTAYSITEDAIATQLNDQTSNKSEQLKKDLDNLQVDLSGVKSFKKEFIIRNRAEALGAKYVVEGSALGGMVISKEIPHCPALKEIEEHHFFNGNRKSMDGWRNFTKSLKSETFTQEEEEDAINKAKETFRFFGKIFTKLRLHEIEK